MEGTAVVSGNVLADKAGSTWSSSWLSPPGRGIGHHFALNFLVALVWLMVDERRAGRGILQYHPLPARVGLSCRSTALFVGKLMANNCYTGYQDHSSDDNKTILLHGTATEAKEINTRSKVWDHEFVFLVM